MVQPSNGMHQNEDGEWVDFDSFSFKRAIKAKRKKRMGRDPEEQGRDGRPDAPSVASWMQKPVKSDASWMPVAPPAVDPIETEDTEAREPPAPRIPRSPAQRRSSARQHPPASPRSNRPESQLQSLDNSRGGASSARRGRALNRLDSSNSTSVASEPDHEMSEAGAVRGTGSITTRRSVSSAPVSGSRGRQNVSVETNRSRGPSPTPSPRARSTSRPRTPSNPPPATNNRGRSEIRTTVAGPRSSSRGSTQSAPKPVTRTRSSSRGSTRSAPRPVQSAVPVIPSRTIHSGHNPGPGLPRPNRPIVGARETGDEQSVRSAPIPDTNIGRELAFGLNDGLDPLSCLTPRITSRKEGGIMERLFGDQGTRTPSRILPGEGGFQLPERLHPRILLSATVYHNAATNLWITTINTNQRGVATNPTTAAKHLKVFTFSSEKEARESAIANAPPKMLSFADSNNCFLCNTKFAVFKRPCHCRNCGVCLCSGCALQWPAKFIPETYNLKNEKTVRVCVSCDWLSQAFKKALLNGNYEESIALYGSGNVNLRTPFLASKKDKKGEIMYPIHCAVEGGNLNIVRWLLDERFCTIKKVSGGKGKKKRGTDIPTLTSTGRSVLSIAMAGQKVDILRYLVVEKNVSVWEVRDLPLALRALDAVLMVMPASNTPILSTPEVVARWADDEYYDDDQCSEISGSMAASANHGEDVSIGNRHNHPSDICIICCDNAIDCVITPCGHQICCLACGNNMAHCPVCNASCEFIRIYR